MAEDSWDRVAVPILEYVHERSLASAPLLGVGAIADAIGVDATECFGELERLIASRFIEISEWLRAGPPEKWMVGRPHLGERGARIVGAWPSDDPLRELVALLEARAQEESEPGELSKLMDVAKRLTEIGSGVITGVLTAYLKRMSGLP